MADALALLYRFSIWLTAALTASGSLTASQSLPPLQSLCSFVCLSELCAVRNKHLNVGMLVAVFERGAYGGNRMGMRLLAAHARRQATPTYALKHLQHLDLKARSRGQKYPRTADK